MNKRAATTVLAIAAMLSLSAVSACSTQASAPTDAPSESTPDTDDASDTEALTEHFETGSEFLLQDIKIVEATEIPAR